VFLGHIGQCNEANFPFCLQLGQGSHGRVKRRYGIGDVQLVDVDTIEAQPP
jgi:hypothetical protein